ncbi:MAG: hypothetical protein LBF02_00735 [Mycoplasmataceae bacterium]|jgi:alanine dehydrogenase|nr:hypothetical protein [Mycoplasmataceae bacterium]
MNILILKSKTQVAILPNDIARIKHSIFIEKGVGKPLNINDGEYIKNGAKIFINIKNISKFDAIICFGDFSKKVLKLCKQPQTILIVNENLVSNPFILLKLIKKGITTLCMNYICEKDVYKYEYSLSKLRAKFALSIGSFAQNIEKKKNNTLNLNCEYDKNLYFSILNYSYSTFFIISQILKSGGKCCLLESNKNLISLITQNEQIKPFLSNLNIVESSFDSIFEICKKSNILISTTSLPSASAHLRITTDMIQSLLPNSAYIDLSANQGFSSEISTKYNSFKKPFTLNYNKPCFTIKEVCEYFPEEYSSINSFFLSSLLNTFVDDKDVLMQIKFNETINSGIVTFNGKIINKQIAENLHVKKGEI